MTLPSGPPELPTGENTLIQTPNVTGLGISNNINHTPGVETPKVTGADDALVMSWDDLAAITPAQKAKAASPSEAWIDGAITEPPMPGFSFMTQEWKQVMGSVDDACVC